MTDDLALPEAPEPSDGADVELLGLIDRLAELLERSDLSELEIQSGETGVILRKQVPLGYVAVAAPGAGAAVAAAPEPSPGGDATTGHDVGPPARPSVKAPLTG